MPYFDALLRRLAENEPDAQLAFGRHVHWGYWTDPEQATGTAEDYAVAAEAMCRETCDAADLRHGLRILDVGCGFGGTIASLNERFRNVDLLGINIDPRQLARARHLVQPRRGNRIRFVEGNACALPFAAGMFDVVLAVECIFHFPSRDDFFAETARVLVEGGRLVISDFVPAPETAATLHDYSAGEGGIVERTYGKVDFFCTLQRYQELAELAGLQNLGSRPITPHTLPTFIFLRKHHRASPVPEEARRFDRATMRLEVASRMGWLDYTILRFQKPRRLAARA
ncbi:MAG: methyltransferase domain-containing protein [candidate division NC10 bacterium]|nr:methyltransferase domain-containing protein [candidate division NC10 bacterium]